MEINQFIRKYNKREFDKIELCFLDVVKKIYLNSHKFNNAKNKINLTNKYLYKYYKESVARQEKIIKDCLECGKNGN